MISELIERMKTRAREAPAATSAKFSALVNHFSRLLVSAVRYFSELITVSSEGNVLDTGKRYRKTSGHAPLFSLFTFFANRQTS